MKTKSIATLRRKADKLYQLKLISEKPVSIVSGQQTQVIHHFIPKSLSNNLRYDKKNGIPLTNAEHFKHHRVGDPHIVEAILKNYGQEWFDDLQKRRRIPRRLNVTYLKEVIKELT